jgi:hypothetical protein
LETSDVDLKSRGVGGTGSFVVDNISSGDFKPLCLLLEFANETIETLVVQSIKYGLGVDSGLFV